MTKVEQLLEVSRSLHPQERLELAEALWELVAADDDSAAMLLSPAQQAELDRRWERHQAKPDSAIGWDEGMARLAAIRAQT